MQNPHIVRKAANPTEAPPESGIHWINTATNEEFFSVGTSSVADWKPREDGKVPLGGSAGQVLVKRSSTDFDSEWQEVPESQLGLVMASSGLVSGGTVSINADTTKFDVAAGTGYIIDFWTDPLNVVKYPVSWTTKTAVAATYLATHTESYIFIDQNGDVYQKNSLPSSSDGRMYIILAKISHTGNAVINTVNPRYNIAHAPLAQFRDLAAFLKFVNSGNQITPNGANLSINKSLGSMFGLGINDNVQTSPHVKAYASQSPVTFQYRSQTGVSTSNTTSIVPDYYDVAGTPTLIAGGGNQATNQRVYLTISGNIRIQYGQTVYSSLTNAISGLRSESFVEYDNVASSSVLIGVISVIKGATALNNPTQAQFISASKFGEVTVGSSGVSTATLQSAYSNSADPEILTDTTRGALTVKRGSSSDSDNVISVQNGAGSVTASIDGSGNFKTVTAKVLNSSNINLVPIKGRKGGSAQTSTLDTLVDVTGLTFAVEANKHYTFEFKIQNGCNNTGGISYAITTPTSATFRAVVKGTSAGVANRTSALLGTSGVGTPALFNVVNSQGGWTEIWGQVSTGANAGNIQLQFAAGVAGQTITVYAESYYSANEVA